MKKPTDDKETNMKKALVFTLLGTFLLSSCSFMNSSLPDVEEIDSYINAQMQMIENVSEVEIIPEKIYIDVDWGLSDSIKQGKLIENLHNTYSTFNIIKGMEGEPAGLLKVPVDNSITEWYYNTDEYNTLKIIDEGELITIENYYQNSSDTYFIFENKEEICQEIADQIMSFCGISELDSFCGENNSCIFTTDNLILEVNISEESNLLSVKTIF